MMKAFIQFLSFALLLAVTNAGCYWDVVECLDKSGYCCKSTWHTLPHKESGSGRLLTEGASNDKYDVTVMGNAFEGIPQYLSDRFADGALSQMEFALMNSFYQGLKTCREYENGITVVDDPGAAGLGTNDGSRKLGGVPLWW